MKKSQRPGTFFSFPETLGEKLLDPMNFRNVTIKDIAQALGLSFSTVSKALRDHHEISEETCKRVRAYAEEIGYKPNPMAIGLRKGRSKSIGVVIPKINNDFISQAISGIESAAHKKDYNVIISQSLESVEREKQLVHQLFSYSIDGLLIALSAESYDIEHLRELHRRKLPIVFFDRISEELPTHTVVSNNFKGAYDATVHLIGQGYTTIAHIAGPKSLSFYHQRLKGYLKALEDHQLPTDEHYIRYSSYGPSMEAEMKEALTELFSMKPPPDAILTGGDAVTTATLTALKTLTVPVPHRLALAGFTNSVASHLFYPPLTCIVQPAFQMGETAADSLIQLIEAKRPVTRFNHYVLENELIIRASTKS